jgi:predicted deacylase
MATAEEIHIYYLVDRSENMIDHTSNRIELARLPSGISVETTIHIYEGSEPGPTVYVQAAQHGQEVNGTEVLRRFHEEILSHELQGTVIAVPVADPLTFDHVSYTTPGSLDSVNSNMNRVWPGDAEGTIHERMAARLWDYASGSDAIVDLHTGSPDMLTHIVFTENHEPSRVLAEAFGTELLLGEPAGENADTEWHDRDFDGKLRVVGAMEGIPTITPELAHNKQIVEPAIETGLCGLRNVLCHLDMLDSEPELNGDSALARNHLGRMQADESGLFRYEGSADLGDHVTNETLLGTLYDPTTYEVLQEVKADRDGILYSIAREATVAAGDTLVSVALVRE